MPPSENPPNPNGTLPPPSQLPGPPSEPGGKPEPIKFATRRFGELDHTELVQLLDSLEGDQAKSRFRESIYISIIFYLALAFLLVYGPRYMHYGTVVPSAAELKEKQHLAEMELNRDLANKPVPKPPKPPPKLDRKAIEQLQTMQREAEAAKAAQPAPAPAPTPAPAPAPAPTPPPAAVAQSQLPSAPMPQPRPAPSQLPDNPLPSAPSAPSVAQSMNNMANNPSPGRLGGGARGPVAGQRFGQQAAAEGAEILSDTQGVDFSDYIRRLLRMVKAAWIPLIPEECNPPISKEGTTLIRFTIEPNGVVSAMHLDDSSHDNAINHAAWGAITGVGQFAPLPKAYKGSLELRIQFIISRNAPASDY